MFELQAKIGNHWRYILRHSDEDYLNVLRDRQFSRHKKCRIVRIR